MSLRRFGGGDIVAVALLVSLAMAYGAVHSPLVAIGLLFAIVFAGWVVMRPDLVLLVVVAALPWQDKLQYPNATLSLVKLLGLALVAAYFLRAVRQNEVVRLPPVLGFALAFGLVIGLALIASPEPSAGLEKAFRYVFFILFLFLMIQMIDTRAQATRLLRVLVASCAAAALYGIVGFVSGTVERASGPIADPNDFAYMMAAVIPFALFLCVEDRRWRLVWVTSTLLLLGATFATLSRGAIVGLAALLLWAILTRRIGIGGTLAVAIAAVLVVAAAFTFWASTVEERLTEKSKIAAANTESRAAFWQAAEEMWEDHPALGVGPGRFPVEAKDYVKNSPIELENPIVHNSYIEILVEAGPIALLLFLGMLAAAWLGATRAARQARSHQDPTKVRLVSAAKGSLLVAIVSGFFLSEQIAPPFWIACALIGSGALYVAQERRERVGGELQAGGTALPGAA
ncbi:MAG TPA: O-antigen ligase family protein [Solirubrobacterales bacterium]|nr:O-antigen ligase family protein [Solirubrobacterales bacterium]